MVCLLSGLDCFVWCNVARDLGPHHTYHGLKLVQFEGLTLHGLVRNKIKELCTELYRYRSPWLCRLGKVQGYCISDPSALPSSGEIDYADLGAKSGVPPCSTLVLAVG